MSSDRNALTPPANIQQVCSEFCFQSEQPLQDSYSDSCRWNLLRFEYVKLLAPGEKENSKRDSDNLHSFENVKLLAPGEKENSKKEILQLGTRGTTIVLCCMQDHLVGFVDSRENFPTTDFNYISNDRCTKFRTYWKRVFVAYIGDVKMGGVVLSQLDKVLPKDVPLTVEAVADLVFEFHPRTAGSLTVYVGGLMPTGEPCIHRVDFKYDMVKPYKKQQESNMIAAKQVVVFGSGLKGLKEVTKYLKSFADGIRSWKDIDKIKDVSLSAFIRATIENNETGGYINMVHLERVAESIECKVERKKTINWMFDTYGKWEDTKLIFLLHERQINKDYFQMWLRSEKIRLAVKLGSPVVFEKIHKLVFSALIVDGNASNVDTILSRGKDSKLLSPLPTKEVTFDNKVFYMTKPCKAFLDGLDVEPMDEYDSIPAKYKVGEDLKVADEDISDSDEEDMSEDSEDN